jgi:hypothetical protein
VHVALVTHSLRSRQTPGSAKSNSRCNLPIPNERSKS